MRKWTICKGCHYSTFFPSIKRVKDGLEFTKEFEFTDSCKYVIDEASCVNKLFGFCFGLFGVHKNSFRVGWTYDDSIGKFALWDYLYKNRKLNKHIIHDAKFDVGEKFKVTIKISPSIKGNEWKNIELYINDEFIIVHQYQIKNKWLLTLGFYFGGNTKAPHKMQLNVY